MPLPPWAGMPECDIGREGALSSAPSHPSLPAMQLQLVQSGMALCSRWARRAPLAVLRGGMRDREWDRKRRSRGLCEIIFIFLVMVYGGLLGKVLLLLIVMGSVCKAKHPHRHGCLGRFPLARLASRRVDGRGLNGVRR